jgi:hypothetical protein
VVQTAGSDAGYKVQKNIGFNAEEYQDWCDNGTNCTARFMVHNSFH